MKIQRAALVVPLVAMLALVYSLAALASAPAAPAGAPAAESALITATGTALIPGDASTSFPQSVYAMVQKMGSLLVTGSLTADVADIKMLAAAIGAASASGATQVNAGGGKPQPNISARPPDAAL